MRVKLEIQGVRERERRERGKERDVEREGERKEYVSLSGMNVSGVMEWHASLTDLMSWLHIL